MFGASQRKRDERCVFKHLIVNVSFCSIHESVIRSLCLWVLNCVKIPHVETVLPVTLPHNCSHHGSPAQGIH